MLAALALWNDIDHVFTLLLECSLRRAVQRKLSNPCLKALAGSAPLATRKGPGPILGG